MGYMIQVSDEKRDRMSELCEKMLRAGGRLMQCIEDMGEKSMDESEEDYGDDAEYEEAEPRAAYGRYGRAGMRRGHRAERFMR